MAPEAAALAELAAAGKPSLLVPFAAAADDHQTRNADEMQRAGAAELLPETSLAQPELLLEALMRLLGDPARLKKMSAAARTQAHPDAAIRIAERIAGLGNS